MHRVPIHVTWDELNLLTLLLLVAVIVGIWLMHRSFKKWVSAQIRDFRIEVVRSLAGTTATSWEMKEARNKLLAVEAKVEYIEAMVSAHIGSCNGNSVTGSSG